MSLIGIDVGSSSVKAAAYREDGELLSVASSRLTPLHPEPGLWEQDPEEIWEATSRAMCELAASEALRRDPPKAIAISASGRENFLADAEGNPIAHGVMGADIRGAEFDVPPPGAPVPEPWCISCGHLRERMDPVFRLMWWRKYHPELVDKATYFLGWHDFLALRISGHVVTDRSTASRYLVYDLETHDWSTERVAEYQIGNAFLPEVLPWPAVIGTVRPEIAEAWGLPAGVQLALGGHDVNCAAVGAGVSQAGEACLISGSYENLLVMTRHLPTPTMLLRGLSVMPHPGDAEYSALAVCPTGNAVLNWARGLVGISISDMDQALSQMPPGPSPVTAVPYLSGAMVYWEEGRKATGALLGLTLATSPVDVVKAFMESIAYDHVNTLDLLDQEGVPVSTIRATGGGARSEWWTHLKADLTGARIEVAAHEEAGTLGAALLAGAAIGIYDDLDVTSRAISGTSRVCEPDPKRAALYAEQIEQYRLTVQTILDQLS